MTPYYLFDEDAVDFHENYKNICDIHGTKGTYDICKQWCDDYFYLPARQEHRGIGGIFFDDLSSLKSFSLPSSKKENDIDNIMPEDMNDIDVKENELNQAMFFTQSVCNNFMPSYLPIVTKRKSLPYNENQRYWQLLRRGRYIEFNLLYDRGVKFGLVPGGKILSHN